MTKAEDQLTPNFALSEFEKSATAIRKGIDNRIQESEQGENLQVLCEMVLQPIRGHFGKPVRVNSGYRCPALSKFIGSDRSQHCKGEAADIEIAGLSNYDLAEWIRDNLPFDQLILEGHMKGDPNSGWVHVSYCRHKERKQVLTAVFKGGKPTYFGGLQA